MKFLVPVDGSKSSIVSVKAAKKLGSKFGAKIYLLTVVPEPQFFDQNPTSFPYSTDKPGRKQEPGTYAP